MGWARSTTAPPSRLNYFKVIIMTITTDIRTTLIDYLNQYPEEKADLAPALDLLDTGAEIASRKEPRGHATVSAILTTPPGKVLFIHSDLGQWLLPGDHLGPDDATLIGAALRRLTEETGIRPELVDPLQDTPMHITVHPKGDHQHIDFRFVFAINPDNSELQTEEVTNVEWCGVGTITDERLRFRLAAVIC